LRLEVDDIALDADRALQAAFAETKHRGRTPSGQVRVERGSFATIVAASGTHLAILVPHLVPVRGEGDEPYRDPQAIFEAEISAVREIARAVIDEPPPIYVRRPFVPRR
jgi:hypothetical protein